MTLTDIVNTWDEFFVPIEIRAHMKKVAIVCKKMGEKGLKKGISINIEILIKAAFLHDTLRVCEIKDLSTLKEFHEKGKEWQKLKEKYGKIGHVEAIVKILEERGETDIAEVIKTHNFFKVDYLETMEQKILFYADKRVDKNQIVSLEQRFKTGRQRNQSDLISAEELINTENKVRKLEKEIISLFGKIPSTL